MPVKLSVIIPVYNAEKYIGQCLDSILSSPLGDMELLVIDDGSGDKSFSICSHYARKDERVIALQKKNEGQSKTRNLGLKYAKGEYVTFVDCDDWVDGNIYPAAYEYAKKGQADIVIYNVDAHRGETMYPYTNIVREQMLEGASEIGRFVMAAPYKICDGQDGLHSIFPVWNKLYKKSFLDVHALRFQSYKFEDVLFNIDAFAYASKITFLPEKGYNWRLRENSASNREMKYRKGFEMELYGIAKYLLQCTRKYEKAYRDYGLCNRVIGDVLWECLECNILNKENTPGLMKRYRCFQKLMEDPMYQKAMEWRFAHPVSRRDVVIGKSGGLQCLPVFFILAVLLQNRKRIGGHKNT